MRNRSVWSDAGKYSIRISTQSTERCEFAGDQPNSKYRAIFEFVRVLNKSRSECECSLSGAYIVNQMKPEHRITHFNTSYKSRYVRRAGQITKTPSLPLQVGRWKSSLLSRATNLYTIHCSDWLRQENFSATAASHVMRRCRISRGGGLSALKQLSSIRRFIFHVIT
jgi:hypothetical protein